MSRSWFGLAQPPVIGRAAAAPRSQSECGTRLRAAVSERGNHRLFCDEQASLCRSITTEQAREVLGLN